MIKSDIDTRIDDGRRKTGTTFIGTDEKTRYENLALQDVSSQVDLDGQDTSALFSFVVTSGNSAINALSAVTPNLKDRQAVIAITATSSFTQLFSHVRPEDFDYMFRGNYWTVDANSLKIRYEGTSQDTLRVRYYSNFVAQTSGGSLSSSMTASTDEPLIDNAEQEAVIEFVLMKVFHKEGKRDDFRDSEKRYKELLKRIKEKNQSRRSLIFDRMTVEDQYSSDWTSKLGWQ